MCKLNIKHNQIVAQVVYSRCFLYTGDTRAYILINLKIRQTNMILRITDSIVAVPRNPQSSNPTPNYLSPPKSFYKSR